ncbi:MAG: radical SAM protein [Hydrogenophilales bacterium]|nr:radical SAM protein [Hydrogenophilales bacterium]
MTDPLTVLSIEDHDRGSAGMVYVYPVVSRRAGGVSVGINLNINNACNWRCIYCQVPDLKRGGPPPVDMTRLRDELYAMLADIVHGDFMTRHVPEGMRRLNDIALSGNGEPTSAPEFAEVVGLVGEALTDFGLRDTVKPVLISNGSLMRKAYVQEGLEGIAAQGGEVWFKLDRASQVGMRTVNGTEARPEQVVANLKIAAGLCPTWIQTCLFELDGLPPSEDEIDAYLRLLGRLQSDGVPLRGVLLYGLARPSLQPEAPRLSRLPEARLIAFGGRIEAMGYACKAFP